MSKRIWVVLCVAVLSGCPAKEGLQGSPGVQGPAGPKGDPGIQGTPGEQGPQGPPGQLVVLDGGVVKGPPGASVVIANAGSACPSGGVALSVEGGTPVYVCNGAPGSNGTPGLNGAAGTNGAAGPQGLAGPSGAPGTVFGERGSRFAGFTTDTFSGSHGGREAMHASCRAQFADSHLCHATEYVLAQSATVPPATGAWVDPSCADSTDNLGHLTVDCNNWGEEALPESGRQVYVAANSYDDHSCTNWTSTSTAVNGLTIQPAGPATAACTSSLPLACCSTVFLESFRGFTVTPTSGNVGGRAAMHGRCAAQFAGSHLCHIAEYHRGHPTSVPVAGAWVDASSLGNYGFVSNHAAVPKAGRFLGRDSSFNRDSCKQWTSSATANRGFVVQPQGTATANCDAALVLACCGG